MKKGNAIIGLLKEVENINKKLEKSNLAIKIFNFRYKDAVLIILKKEMIQDIFVLKATSSCQINIIKDRINIETDFCIDNIGAWIFNLYNPVKKFYKFSGGKLNNKIFTDEDLDKINNIKRKKSNNEPIIKDYIGPMIDKIDYGKIYFRYETQKEYNDLTY